VDYYNKEKRSQDENCKLNVPSLSSSFEQLGKMLNPRIYSPTENLPLRYDAPFRNQKNPEYQLDPENGTSLAEEEYAGLTGTSYRALKSFVKVRGPSSVEAEASMLQENRKSSTVGFSNFVTRRKFSTRGMGRYIGQTSFNATEGDGDQPGHFRSVSSAINVDINAASITHVKRLVRQMLIDEMISNIEAWHEVIIKILLTICKSINPDVRNGDEIDVRNYIKIKKIPGGSIAESHYVNGVVATKRALHKKMLKPVQNPKILLITFPLEYQRVQGEYLSLEPVLSQEREHLKNLVGRLIALKPDVIMVEKTVARVALEYLLGQNIIVIQNVKSNVLSAVARCSKAEIIHSIDKLSPKGLGLCKEFCFKTYHNNSIPGIRKSYLFVQGCNDELGCTIVLRGDKMNTLKKIKGIVDFVAFVVYSLKLETCLFQDQYAKVPTVTEDLAEKKIADNLSDLEVAVKRFESKILSGSPNVKYPLPHVVLRLLEQEKKNSMVADHKSITSKKSDLELVSRKIDLLSLSNDNTSVKEQVQIPNMKAPDLDMLSPFTEQNLFVMYSNICINSTVPCISPFPHFIYFYSDSDMTLGQYIEDSCYSSKFDCPVKSCEK
jgi:1-phosphatidylinositol-3-phosphate 5-kinase